MKEVLHNLMVDTPSHRYPIYIGSGIFADFALLKAHIGKKVAIVTNDVVAPLYLAKLQKVLQDNGVDAVAIVLPDGEQHKNHDALNLIYDGLLRHHADRKTTIIALGGGVIGDMAGFAAATYQRGIPFVQVPTTLLSQVDSSVGGKTAINHPLGKNMIGAFYQPQAVFADLDTLDTLPERELSAGMAEVIKYALLGDADFLRWLEANMAAIVAQDETEQGVRALLNLGHTFGHAIEAEMGYGTWLHGEAVAAGCVLACVLSERLGSLKTEDTARVRAMMRLAKLPDAPPAFAFERWLAHMRHDKKVDDGTLRFVTLAALGQAVLTPVDDIQILRDALQSFVL